MTSEGWTPHLVPREQQAVLGGVELQNGYPPTVQLHHGSIDHIGEGGQFADLFTVDLWGGGGWGGEEKRAEGGDGLIRSGHMFASESIRTDLNRYEQI